MLPPVKGSTMELWAAVRRNDVEQIRAEVAAGADLRYRSRRLEVPVVLEWASANERVRLTTLKVLVEVGAPLRGKSGEVALAAAKTGNLERVRYFADLGCSVTAADEEGYTALHHAILRGGPAAFGLVNYLLDAGVNPDRRSSNRRTAIGCALSVNQIGIAHLLLDRGAMRSDPNWTEMLTAVIQRDFAAIDAHRDQVNFQFFSSEWWAPIHVAVSMGDLDLVEKLAALGVDLSFDDGDCTLFPLAVSGGSIPVIEWCAEHGCGGKIGGSRFEGLHQAAAASGRIPVAQWLFDHGVPTMDEDFASPLHACRTPEMADFYLAQGENIDEISGEGYSVLMRAAEEGDGGMAGYWIRKGANVDATSSGATALHYAVQADSDSVVDLLIGAGAEVDAKDVDGFTPLGQAISVAMAQKLIAAGANPDERQYSSMTARQLLLHRDEAFGRLFA
jgi:ankyrin repeat protein